MPHNLLATLSFEPHQLNQQLRPHVTVATAGFSPPHIHLTEVAICFGGRLMRGNRCRKVS